MAINYSQGDYTVYPYPRKSSLHITNNFGVVIKDSAGFLGTVCCLEDGNLGYTFHDAASIEEANENNRIGFSSKDIGGIVTFNVFFKNGLVAANGIDCPISVSFE